MVRQRETEAAKLQKEHELEQVKHKQELAQLQTQFLDQLAKRDSQIQRLQSDVHANAELSMSSFNLLHGEMK